MKISADMTVLYVRDIPTSVAFYSELFSTAPLQQTPGFAFYILANGMKLGLWNVKFAQPASSVTGGGCELVVNLDSRDAVDAALLHWRGRGIVGQDAVEAEFGYTFTVMDPDQHRIRALYSPEG